MSKKQVMGPGSSTTSPMSVMEPPAEPLAWEIPRRRALQEKRAKLTQKRVNLEERLFAYSAVAAVLPDSTEHSESQTADEPAAAVQKFLLSNQPVLFTSYATDLVSDEAVPAKSDQLPSGSGKLIFKDGQVYEGEVQFGRRHGRGRNEWKDGQVYQGQWKRNRRHGRGTHHWPDGRQATGQWVEGHLQGRVCFVWPDQSYYEGEASCGQKEGRGSHYWANGRVYQGSYRNGVEDGYGVLSEADGVSSYRGHFVEGKRHGHGVQVWPQKTYDGTWKDNVVAGKGKLVWANGSSYVGDFERGVYEGHGCFHNAESKYVGNWKQGKKNGFGKQYWTVGKQYMGHFRSNKRHGFGRMDYEDGSFYAGSWRKGKRHGLGIYVNADGVRVHCGVWENDHPVFQPGLHGRRAKDDADAERLTKQRESGIRDYSTIVSSPYSLPLV